MWFTHEKPFNKTTLIHKFISTRAYAKQNKFLYFWVGDNTDKVGPFTRACRYLKGQGVTEICVFDPIDKPLIQSIKSICKTEQLSLRIDDTPSFLESNADLDTFLRDHPPKTQNGIRSYSHNTFYKWQRQRLNILMTKDNKPVGGKLTYDTENRKPFPKGTTTDPTFVRQLPLPKGVSGSDIKDIIDYVGKEFKSNPGVLPILPPGEGGRLDLGNVSYYPMTTKQAKQRLTLFIKKALSSFGPYEDAIHPDIIYAYHSVLSSSLNNGLLTPNEILSEINKLSPPDSTLLPSIEGFVRQVFGWRSYCRLIYREERDVMMRSNYLKHTNRLPKSWFTNKDITTKIPWLDDMFKHAYDTSYAHHIVRLMVFSQWFLLMRIHPRDVLDWFWSVISIDAYEWVMVPNVLGMGQYADGGIMMTRPYVSSNTYLEKMSRNTLKGNVILKKNEYPWKDIWRALYYDFLMKQQPRLGKMYSYSSSYAYLKKTTDTQKQKWKTISKKYRKLYNDGSF
jgi:deoxyribodipyrimidine photolyase-related protein